MTSGGGSSGYDSLNRLAGAQATSGPYQGLQAAWSYDSFGNRTAESFGGNTSTVTAPIPGNTSFGYSGSNQINSVAGGSPPSYDAAGNVTCDSYNATSTPPQCLGPNQYLYDAEGRECAVENLLNGGAMTGYLYDAEGNRVAKGTITSWSCNTATNGFTMSSSSILGPGNEQLTELSWSGGTPQWAYTNVFAGGRVIGAYSPNPNPDAGSNNVPLDQLNFYLTDWLGTRRVMTDSNGVVQATCLSLPYGNGETCTATPSEQLYATLDRDTESGLDHAMFRQYNFMTGRWISPDPYFGSIDANNPQSFNRYAYVNGMPMTYIDPSGLDGGGGGAGAIGCVGAVASSGGDIPDDIECAISVFDLVKDIIGLFDHPHHLTAATKARPNAQPWDEYNIHYGANIGAALGLPGAGCEFGACGFSPGSGGANFSKNTIDPRMLYVADALYWAFTGKHSGPSPRIHGNWCGPGGAGFPVDSHDWNCMFHDYCYNVNNLSASDNLFIQPPGKRALLHGCNQALCNAESKLGGWTASEITGYFSIIPSADNGCTQ